MRILRATARHALRAVGYFLAGGFVVAVVALVWHMDGRPDLDVWHTVDLDEEFRAGSDVDSFAEYLALEDRLFEQLRKEVYDEIDPAEHRDIARYHSGSLSDPGRWPRDWNRSFELPAKNPRAGVLLIHGMSDSPYSLHSLGERLHAEGALVVGLRVPGHGTAPSGLVDVEWEDMAAAVRIAVRHLRERVGSRPLLLVGYSNGGALAVEYSLAALENDELPLPDQLVLLSPEIGITRFAVLAVWQERLGHVLGLEKLAWNSILPEYDPFKYGSFAMNAGMQAYLITEEIRNRIERLGTSGALERFPPTLAFQSVVDATVSAPALVTGLFDPLPAAGGHELVLFDINRLLDVEMLLKRDPAGWLDDMLAGARPTFTVSAVMNENEETADVVLRRLRAGEKEHTEEALGLEWPTDVYSLAHVALPFSPEDPVYGGPQAGKSPGIQLGELALRGERGVLEIGASELLRLRWNPFYPYVERRVIEALDTIAPRVSEAAH